MRTCIGCRTVRPATELRRFVRAPDGIVHQTATAPGRGAWVCADASGSDCLLTALANKAFARSFRAKCGTDGLVPVDRSST